MARRIYEHLNRDVKHMLGLPSLAITEYEARVLVALAEGPRVPSEVCSATDIPRTKTYEVLNSLVNKKLVVQIGSKPLTFALERDALSSMIDVVDRSSRNAISFLKELEAVSRLGYSETVKEDVAQALEELGFTIPASEKDLPYMTALSPHGWKIVVVYPDEDLLTGKGLELAAQFRRKKDADLVLALCSSEIYPKVRRYEEEHGLIFLPYRRGELQDILLKTLDEFEYIRRETLRLRNEYEALSLEVDNASAESSSTLQRLRSLIEAGREGLEREDAQAQLQSFEREVTGNRYELQTVEIIYQDSLRKVGENGYTEKVKMRLAGAVDNIARLKERIEDLKGRIASYVSEVEAFPEINLQLGFRPLNPKPRAQDIVDQEEFMESFDDYIRKCKSFRRLSTSILLGEYGGGKTLLCWSLMNRINSGVFGRLASALTPADESFLKTYNNFILSLSAIIPKIEVEMKWPPILQSQKTFFGVLRGFRSSTADLRDRHGFEYLYWFIDEFDKVLKLERQERIAFIGELKGFIDTLSETPLSITLAITKEGYHMLEEEHPELVNRIPNFQIFTLKTFELKDIETLLSKLSSSISDPHRLSLLQPDHEALTSVLEASQGNPRRTIHLLNEIVYRSLKTERKFSKTVVEEVLKDLLKPSM